MPDIFVSKEKVFKKPILNKSTLPEKSVFSKKSKKYIKKQRRKRLDSVLGAETVEDFCKRGNGQLASFCYYPKNLSFINKDPEEEIILLVRKHVFTNFRWIIIALIMLLAPAFYSVLPFFEFLPSGFKVIIVLIWYLITFAFILEKFLSWFFNVNILTDERIIEVDFLNLIYREMTDANIDQIQDVTVQMGGGIRTLLNFGNIQIQTAAEIPQIQFESIPAPDKVAKILRELRVEEEIEKIEGRVR